MYGVVSTPETTNVSPLPVLSKSELFRLFLKEKTDPEPFYTALAQRSISEFPFPVEGRRILDLGSGPGWYARALHERGADVVPVDMGDDDVDLARRGGLPVVQGDALRTPFPAGVFDGVFCSNMLEHVPETRSVFDEIERVLRPGGWAWVSWTNWYSPWGGHEIVPFHYLGPDRGRQAYVRFFGEPRKNDIYDALWPTSIAAVLDEVRHLPGLRLLDAVPRYYPSQRWILKVPGVREVFTWNCLLTFQRNDIPARAAT